MNSIACKNLNRLLFLLSVLLATFPLWSLRTQSVLIILFCIPAVSGLFFINKTLIKKRIGWVFLFSSITLLTALYYFISEDSNSALLHVEKKVGLVVIPVAFLLWPISLNRKQLLAIKWIFTISCLLLVVKLFFLLVFSGLFIEALKDDNFYFIFRRAAENITNIHPSYFALYLSFIICFLFIEVLSKKQQSVNILIAISIILAAIFVIVIWLLAARMAFVGLLICLIIIAIWQIKSKSKLVMALALMLGLFLASIFLSPSLKQRTSQLFTSGFSIPENEDFNETNIRLAIYSCSFELIKQNWLIGYSPGDLHMDLNGCYNEKFDSDKLRGKNYNTHNEYLNQWLGNGLMGLILFILVILLPFRLAGRKQEKLYIIFLVLFSIACLTENILSRQHGMLFYVFFNSMLFFNQVLEEPNQ